MAIDLGVQSLFVENFEDYYSIGRHRQIIYEVDFGTAPTNKLVNINFFLFGESVGQINAPYPTVYGEIPEGYNIICDGTTTGWIDLDMSHPYKHLWKNWRVEGDFYSSGILNIRLTYMGTMDMASWIKDKESRNNNKRFWMSKHTDIPEFTITPKTVYDSFVGNEHYLGVKVAVYNIVDEQYILSEQKILADQRNDKYFWNPVSPTDPTTEWPYSPVKSYAFELTRNTVPVTNFSTTQDTHVKFKIVTHTLDYTQSYDSGFNVGLVKIDPDGTNADDYMNDLPAAYGYNTGAAFNQEENFPKQLNGFDIVIPSTAFTNTSGNNWEAEFDIPKEVIDPGCKYRLYVVILYAYNLEF